MQIIALQQYTDQYVSLYEGQIRNLSHDLATRLISKGIVAEHDEINTSGSGSTGANSDSTPNYAIYYADELASTKFLYVNKSLTEQLTAIDAFNNYNNKDFILVKNIDDGRITKTKLINACDYYEAGQAFSGSESYTRYESTQYHDYYYTYFQYGNPEK